MLNFIFRINGSISLYYLPFRTTCVHPRFLAEFVLLNLQLSVSSIFSQIIYLLKYWNLFDKGIVYNSSLGKVENSNAHHNLPYHLVSLPVRVVVCVVMVFVLLFPLSLSMSSYLFVTECYLFLNSSFDIDFYACQQKY